MTHPRTCNMFVSMHRSTEVLKLMADFSLNGTIIRAHSYTQNIPQNSKLWACTDRNKLKPVEVTKFGVENSDVPDYFYRPLNKQIAKYRQPFFFVQPKIWKLLQRELWFDWIKTRRVGLNFTIVEITNVLHFVCKWDVCTSNKQEVFRSLRG